MTYPIFLSVVMVLRDSQDALEQILSDACQLLSRIASDYELIIVDNASEDSSAAVLEQLTGETGLPNLQVYALTKQVDTDTALWVGLENALGDFVAVMDPLTDSLDFLPDILEKALEGADVVFAKNERRAVQTLPYRIAEDAFNWLYRHLGGIHLSNEAPQYRVLSKKVINFIVRHPRPSVTYRHLPATGGFSKAILSYDAPARAIQKKRLSDSIEKGVQLLASTTRTPMRLVTGLSLFGAAANLLYSIYVVLIAIFKTNIAPGWVSLSLQQSGMFFLISLVLLVLGEYILNMASLSNEGPTYHIAQEFTSAKLTRQEKLNITEPREPGIEGAR